MSSYAERAGASLKNDQTGKPAPKVGSAASVISAMPSSAPAATVPPTKTAKSAKPAASNKSDSFDIYGTSPIEPKTRVQGIGRVKDVLSASTLVVVGASNKEKRLIISGINAPKLGFGKTGADEPFAFPAKEFVRALLLGKKVNFTLPNGSSEKEGAAEYAEVFLEGVNVAHMIVSNGWAKVAIPKYAEVKPKEPEAEVAAPAKEPKKGKKGEAAAAAAPAAPASPAVDVSQLPAERAELYAMQVAAEKSKVGMFKANPAATVRAIDWAPSHLAWIKKYKGQQIPAIVDRVLDGTTLRLEVPDPSAPATLKHTMLTVSLAGALSPRMPLSTDKEKAPPAGAAEAVAMVEQRLLHRDVDLVLQGIDKAGPATNAQGALYGTVLHPKGNIAVRLLEENLAKYVPWTAALLGDTERAAVQAAAGVTASTGSAAGAPYQATVVQIVSGDMIVVKDAAGAEHKVAFASVSAPRALRGEPEKFAFEAKEFLRKSLILKQVTVVPEYTRALKTATPEEKPEQRMYVTVYAGAQNVAVGLVAAGLADVVGYAKEADRPASYVELCQAEAAAIAGEKGKHSKKAAPAQVQDFTRVSADRKKTGDDAKAAKAEAAKNNHATSEIMTRLLSKLTAQKRVAAVVEAVFTPNLIKVFVPLLHAYIPVSFSAIQGPRAMRKNVEVNDEDKEKIAAKDKAYSDAALALLKGYLQQDVTLEIDSIGRQDSFIGNILVSGASKENKESLAVLLVKQGLAGLIPVPPIIERNSFAAALRSAETEARRKHLNIWADYDEEKEARERARERTEAAKIQLGAGFEADDKGVQFVEAVVTDVADPVHFYINSVKDPNVKVVRDRLASFDAAPAPEDFKPKKGDIVAGLFDDDKKWYRVRIENVNKSQLHQVKFIDFGNMAALALGDLRPLPKEIASIAPLARPCALSALRPPKEGSEYYEAAANALADMTASDMKFLARVDHVEGVSNPLLHLTLFAGADKSTSVNAELLKAGWVRVNSRPGPRLANLVPELDVYESEGRAKRYNIWEYGAGYDGSDNDE
jgi:staphylococcal nuclease domain-containing protein 1